MNLATINKKLSDATAALAKAEMDLKLEIAGAAADAAGIVDPTPTSDLIAAGISVARGDYAGAALSVASTLPYLGDALAKPVKASRFAKKAIELEKKIATLTKTVNDLKKAKKVAEKTEKSAQATKISNGTNISKKTSAEQAERAPKRDKDCEDCKTAGRPTKIMPRVEVKPCFSSKKLDPSKSKEFEQQLKRQEDALNRMSVKDFEDARSFFDKNKRNGTGASQQRARAQYKKKLESALFKKYRKTETSAEARKKAEEEAAERMRDIAALHEPDMIAGGSDTVTNMGDRKVNSSIGSQWKNRVSKLDEAAKEISEVDKASTRMNVKLPIC